ncbi:hypothetical protein FXN61_45540 [Lentzea sp. PSKA42]|uniref:Peptidase inhibitor family I36 n=1 Tax=Lentzea indica TaxID=2604800 RepID=A0ABX1FX21_9PSEU|nr:hypothetical protein [Lentzea indica]NKE63603.1 hypothetical protein [Lentzea indica]
MKLAPALFGRQAIIAAVAGALMLTAPIAVTAEPAAPRPDKSAEARTASQGGPAVAGVNCRNGYHCLFYSDVNSSKFEYFDSVDHFNGNRFSGGDGYGAGQPVDNNSWAASNSSTGNRESHWYDGQFHSGFLFCVNPGATVHGLPENLKDKVSSLRLRPRTSVRCLSN